MELQDAVAVVAGSHGGSRAADRAGRWPPRGRTSAGYNQTSQEQAAGLAAEWSALGSRSAARSANVADPASVRQMVERILGEFGETTSSSTTPPITNWCRSRIWTG